MYRLGPNKGLYSVFVQWSYSTKYPVPFFTEFLLLCNYNCSFSNYCLPDNICYSILLITSKLLTENRDQNSQDLFIEQSKNQEKPFRNALVCWLGVGDNRCILSQILEQQQVSYNDLRRESLTLKHIPVWIALDTVCNSYKHESTALIWKLYKPCVLCFCSKNFALFLKTGHTI